MNEFRKLISDVVACSEKVAETQERFDDYIKEVTDEFEMLPIDKQDAARQLFVDTGLDACFEHLFETDINIVV